MKFKMVEATEESPKVYQGIFDNPFDPTNPVKIAISEETELWEEDDKPAMQTTLMAEYRKMVYNTIKQIISAAFGGKVE